MIETTTSTGHRSSSIDGFSGSSRTRHVIICICICIYLQPFHVASAKEKVDLLVTGGTVVTMDADRRVIPDGAVALRGDSIVAVGARTEIESRYESPRIIDARGGLIMPGLINGH